MENIEFIAAGYLATFGALGLYAARLAWRVRSVARRLPESERQWR